MARETATNWKSAIARDLVSKVPAGVIVLVTAALFLHHIRTTSTDIRATIKDSSDIHAASEERSAKAIDRNTEAFGRISGILDRWESRRDERRDK